MLSKLGADLLRVSEQVREQVLREFPQLQQHLQQQQRDRAASDSSSSSSEEEDKRRGAHMPEDRDDDMEDGDDDQPSAQQPRRLTMENDSTSAPGDVSRTGSEADDRSVNRGDAVATLRSAHRNARQAAERVWERTKVVRSKFPKPPAASRLRKLSATMPRRGSGARGLAAALSGAPAHGSGEGEPELIYDSMKQMWEADVFSLPVCKDLPRLVRRVCVVDKDEEILYLAPGATAPESTMPKPKKAAGEDGDDDVQQQQQQQQRLAKSPKRSSKMKRWSLRRKQNGHKSLSAADLSSNAAVAALMVDFMATLLSQLEPDPETREAVLKGLREAEASVTSGSDLQLVAKDMIVALGPDSAVARVLKTIHQNVVLQSTVEMKQKLTGRYATRDVRSAEGWRVVVWVARQFVQVRHARREQSVDAFGDTKNHWEFEWELRMTFDRRMAGMTAAQLRVTRLILSETMDEDLAEELKSTLVDGLIVM